METTINLIIFTVLIILTAFFVATEFAIVKVRHSRLNQLVNEGKPGALSAHKVVNHLDEYLSACQLGITITALGIGMVGEKTFEFILHPLFSAIGIPTNLIHVFTLVSAFIIATFLHVVVGELAPKTIAIQKAEAVTLAFSKPIIFFYRILYPFIWLLNGSARLLLRLIGIQPVGEHELTHTEEELRMLLADSYQSGEININELKVINNAFEFDEKIAREVMTPRNEVIAIDIQSNIVNVIQMIQQERYTRYPVYEGDKDNIVGYVHIKDFIDLTLQDIRFVQEKQLTDYIHPVMREIETVSLTKLLHKMKADRVHLAILMDEYGGTSGLVTIEDIIEELVGEIRDEFDADEKEKLIKINDNHYRMHSSVLIGDVEKLLGVQFDVDNVDTIGGWMLSFIDENKNEIYHDDYLFKIIKKEGNHIEEIEVMKAQAPIES
ncbi:hemolysin family protein [Macrococcoides caseolyticum]|uniref:hemolysin family protein n=1 Tax=Macrococcoides caseolyticum TaxID=69966 RepID=UPI001F19C903|nr:hemolysin family protein [Macrococcus caseolyticus]MCE4956436.1 HlyC/CorC family transporter [Macrococcus caseolyticus]